MLKVYAKLFWTMDMKDHFRFLVKRFYTPELLEDGIELTRNLDIIDESLINAAINSIGVDKSVELVRKHKGDPRLPDNISLYAHLDPEQPVYTLAHLAKNNTRAFVNSVKFVQSDRLVYGQRLDESVALFAEFMDCVARGLLIMHPDRYQFFLSERAMQSKEDLEYVVKLMTVTVRLGCYIVPLALTEQEYDKVNAFYDNDLSHKVVYDEKTMKRIKKAARQIEPFFFHGDVDESLFSTIHRTCLGFLKR